MDPQPDVYALVATMVKIEAGLRLLAHHPDKYAPNGHFDRIRQMLTALLAEVHSWLDGPPGEQRHQQRRVTPDRRVEHRRTGTDRREPPVTEHVA